MTDEKYYPELSEEGKQEAAKIVADFKEQIKQAADEAISTIETSTIMYIESDSWQNFRNHLMDGFKDYQNNKVRAKYDFKAIRQQILKDNYNEIVKDLNQDLLEEIHQLKLNIQSLQLILNSR